MNTIMTIITIMMTNMITITLPVATATRTASLTRPSSPRNEEYGR